MFGGGPSREEHDALSDVVLQQGQVLALMQEHSEAASDALDQLIDFTTQMRSESLIIKGILGGIIAEIAAKREEPYKELNDILGRVRFTADEFSIDAETFELHAANAREFICQYAEDYLRRGDRQ